MARLKTARVARRNLLVRQAIIYGLLISAFVVGGVAAWGMFTGRLVPWFNDEFTAKPAPSLDLAPQPCPLAFDSTYPDPASFQVNVLNASGRIGAAAAGKGVLDQVGFRAEAANSPTGDHQGGIRVVSGVAGVDNAYAVMQVMPPSARLELDARRDASVDVVLGEASDAFITPSEVDYQIGEPIPPAPGCWLAAEIYSKLDIYPSTTAVTPEPLGD
ncbi:MAG: LytR C-terminal domain-containing protein [Micrococcales bacterium]|nr:LytR C-terminal domain-containing protein [Micrococcales bacterium]